MPDKRDFKHRKVYEDLTNDVTVIKDPNVPIVVIKDIDNSEDKLIYEEYV